MCALKMVLPHKRKRGRPRNDEPKDIKEFDLSLIQEFRNRPAFYDRSHPQYRNREHLEPQWNQIAHSLGYNVPVLKNRMMQLRNRYSLEKRRMETIREQCGDDHEVVSQWTLFGELDFLGDHIKGRAPAAPKEGNDTTMHTSDSEDIEMNNGSADTSLMNGFASGQGRQSIQNASSSQANPAMQNNQQSQQQQQQQQRHQQQEQTQQQIQPPQPRQSQRQQYRQQQLQLQREKELREQAELEMQQQELLRQQQLYFEQQKLERERALQQQQQQQAQEYNQEEHQISENQVSTPETPPISKHAKALDLLHLTSNDSKYVAFGQFISSSLIELNESDALRLVEKFTSELVKTITQTSTSNIAKKKD